MDRADHPLVILDDISDQYGLNWGDISKMEIMAEYIAYQARPFAFIDFVTQQAADEIEAAELEEAE